MTSRSSLAPGSVAWQRSLTRLLCHLICGALVFQPLSSFAQRLSRNPSATTVTVEIDTNHPVNRFIPSRALGAGVDGHAEGDTQSQLSRANIAAMLSAGLKPLIYRLRTELAGEAWH